MGSDGGDAGCGESLGTQVRQLLVGGLEEEDDGTTLALLSDVVRRQFDVLVGAVLHVVLAECYGTLAVAEDGGGSNDGGG